MNEILKSVENLVLLKVRMTDCDAGALGNPHNVGVHGWELPDEKKGHFHDVIALLTKRPQNHRVFEGQDEDLRCGRGNPRNLGGDRACFFDRLVP